jgi:hypothetical protein
MLGRMPKRKAKKSYTLSPESVAFLEAMRKKRRAGSISAILNEILQAVRREHKRASVERVVADYYGSLSTEEALVNGVSLRSANFLTRTAPECRQFRELRSAARFGCPASC